MPDGICFYCHARRPLHELEPHATEEGELICRNSIECVQREMEDRGSGKPGKLCLSWTGGNTRS